MRLDDGQLSFTCPTASVASGHGDLVRDVLRADGVRFDQDGRGAVVGRRVRDDPTVTGRDGRIHFAAKLAFQVQHGLERRGVPTRLVGYTAPPPLDLGHLPGDDPVRALVRRNPEVRYGCLIDYKRPAGRDAAVASLCMAYPNRRVIVATRNRRETAAWVARLRAAGVDRVGNPDDFHTRGESTRVVVLPINALEHPRKEDFAVVIVPDAGLLKGHDPRPAVLDGLPLRRGRTYDLARDPRVPVFAFAGPNARPTSAELRRLHTFCPQRRSLGPSSEGGQKRRLNGGDAAHPPGPPTPAPAPTAGGGYFAAARPRRDPRVDTHTGSRRQKLERVRAEAGRAAEREGARRDAYVERLFDRITEGDNLWSAADHVARESGESRGADGTGPRDLSDYRARKSLVAAYKTALKDGTYRPGETMRVAIPKGDGGVRTISVPTVADRVVQTAILLVLQPFLDPQLGPTVYGFRPKRSVAGAVAALAVEIETTDKPVLLACDVAQAFDSVRHETLFGILRRKLGGRNPTTDLIERIVRANGPMGVAQGGPLSPLLLNVYLDAVLDEPFRRKYRNSNLRLRRWADDLCVACADEAEAEEARKWIETELGKVGLALKASKTEIVDTRKDPARWLGFKITTNSVGTTLGLTGEAWKKLEQETKGAETEDTKEQTIRGWVNAFGPAITNEDLETIQRATGRDWTKTRDAARRRYQEAKAEERERNPIITAERAHEDGAASPAHCDFRGGLAARTPPPGTQDGERPGTTTRRPAAGRDKGSHRPNQRAVRAVFAGEGRPLRDTAHIRITGRDRHTRPRGPPSMSSRDAEHRATACPCAPRAPLMRTPSTDPFDNARVRRRVPHTDAPRSPRACAVPHHTASARVAKAPASLGTVVREHASARVRNVSRFAHRGIGSPAEPFGHGGLHRVPFRGARRAIRAGERSGREDDTALLIDFSDSADYSVDSD